MVRLVITAVWMGIGSAASADDAARAVVERALQATGWDKRTADHSTWKDKGTFTMPGGGPESKMAYEGSFHVTFPDKYRFSLKSKVGDQEFDLLVVVNGNQGWERMMGQLREMPKEKVAYVQTEILMQQVLALKPLLDPGSGFSLSALPDEAVNGRRCQRVKVEKAGRPAITLWFDAETGLPAKMAATVKNEFDNWRDATDELFFTDWRKTETGMEISRLRVLRNGKLMLEAELSEFKMPDKVDPLLYEKPSP